MSTELVAAVCFALAVCAGATILLRRSLSKSAAAPAEKLPLPVSRAPEAERKRIVALIDAASKSVTDDEFANHFGSPSSILSDRLDGCGMKMLRTENDGNCLFAALAFSLFGSPAHHAVVRKAAVAHMRARREYFALFFDGAGGLDGYLARMSQDKTWGDELVIRAVVEAYGCDAHVVSSASRGWYLRYTPDEPCGVEQKITAKGCVAPAPFAYAPKGLDAPALGTEVFLSYVVPNHYNAVAAQEAPRESAEVKK